MVRNNQPTTMASMNVTPEASGDLSSVTMTITSIETPKESNWSKFRGKLKMGGGGSVKPTTAVDHVTQEDLAMSKTDSACSFNSVNSLSNSSSANIVSSGTGTKGRRYVRIQSMESSESITTDNNTVFNKSTSGDLTNSIGGSQDASQQSKKGFSNRLHLNVSSKRLSLDPAPRTAPPHASTSISSPTSSHQVGFNVSSLPASPKQKPSSPTIRKSVLLHIDPRKLVDLRIEASQESEVISREPSATTSHTDAGAVDSFHFDCMKEENVTSDEEEADSAEDEEFEIKTVNAKKQFADLKTTEQADEEAEQLKMMETLPPSTPRSIRIEKGKI